MITKQELDFLRESNNIEEEWDDMSLRDAILAWSYITQQQHRELTVENILETHRLLMQTRDTIPNEDKGRFRTCEVMIAGRLGKPWKVVPELMDQWIKKVNLGVPSMDDEEAEFKKDHINYEKIHPFADGNGRTGRIFYNWQRARSGLPIQIIPAKTKYEDYYKWFK